MKSGQDYIKKVVQGIRGFKESTVILIIILLCAVISFSAPIFLSVDNLKTTAIGLASDGIISIGMTLALISGGFDLSVGSVMGLSAVLTALFAGMGLNIWLSALLAVGVSLLIGLINGIFIGKIGLNPFITTLGMMSIARGLIYVLTQGTSLSINDTDLSFRSLGSGSLFGIPVIVIIFIILAILGDFMVRKSSPAMKVFYVGSNEKAAILSGINTGKVKLYVYLFAALMASIAGILSLSRFGVATANMGNGAEMRVISAAVIGGASLSGGEGSVFGTVLGVLLLNIINNALVLFNVSVHWQNLIAGTILILAVTVDLLSHKRKSI
jgi:Ribose/xylose/arabinose/galactoside ABC-type transport systems, permease components